MRRWLAALLPWMVMTAAWADGPIAVAVDFTFHGTFEDDSVRMDDECWIAPSLLDAWGFGTNATDGELHVSDGDRDITLPFQMIEERKMVSLHEAGRLFGANLSWDESGLLLIVRSVVRNVERTEAGLRIDATLPVLPVFFKLDDPVRFIVDLRGAVFSRDQIGDLPDGWRIGQFKPEIVRVVIESPEMADQYVPTLSPARHFTIQFGANAQPDEPEDPDVEPPNAGQQSGDPGSIGGIVGQEPPDEPADELDVDPTAVISIPNIASASEQEIVLMLPFTGSLTAGPTAKYINPGKIELVVSGASATRPGAVQVYDSDLLQSAMITDDGHGNVHIVFNLLQPLAFELKNNERLITLRFFRPSEASGSLTNKVIVVDAGHGGEQTGTIWNGLDEKDLNLQLSDLLVAELTAAGASVIVTRGDDSEVGLQERADMANGSDADLFISIHHNSNRVAETRSGGMTFFHMQQATSRFLAQCIQTEIAGVSKIPDMGVWSDSRIYSVKGFAVLRFTEMPAVLIELGFLNHSYDRVRVQELEFQESVAKAIVKGLKVFLGDDTN
ncbi:MAG: N-acetylmuramoyl-L-alanine amidase [Armatimonadetes bacterium]|nr:N-acetylmuramoyl-L-alanine amidase [Armatimonadota bacterium]